MRRSVSALLALLFAFSLVSQALAKDIYVCKSTGKNKNPGTKEAPKKLLWKVIGKIEDGDKIHVAEGWYFGKSKSGVMPRFKGKDLLIEGGWNKGFTERNPFKYFTIIAPPADRQGKGSEVFKADGDNITIDGFLIDRGAHAYYFSDGEPGARKRIPGHQDNSCWGYRNMNKGKSGTDPTIELMGRGNFTVRNCILINNFWWGIYIKAGGTKDCVIENNLVLISQYCALEAITGGGWGKPNFLIRNNTFVFNHTMKTTGGRALSIDPRKGLGKYVVEKNVLAFSDGGGFTSKFKPVNMEVKNNKFFFNRRGDASLAGTALGNADEFEDELEIENEGNVHEIPRGLLKRIGKKWLHRWSLREDPNMLAGTQVKAEELESIRTTAGLPATYSIPGYKKTFANYKSLPQARNNYNLSRYPFPMKKGESVDWAKWVMPLVGAEGEWGIQPFEGKPVKTAAVSAVEEAGSGGAASVILTVKFNAELLRKIEAKCAKTKQRPIDVIEEAVKKYFEE